MKRKILTPALLPTVSEPLHITLNGVSMEVVRRRIKTLYLTVYPPDGRVRVAAPLSLTDRHDGTFHKAVELR